MQGNHVVRDVQMLYDDSRALYDNSVLKDADGVIGDLDQAITALKENWKGADAGIQINNVVTVYNAMVDIRNVLATLAGEASRVASYYREIQNSNRANLENLQPLTVNTDKGKMAPYVDINDTINIGADAMRGKALLDGVLSRYDDFRNNAFRYSTSITENWQAGPGRDGLYASCEEFRGNADGYKKVLDEASKSISDAMKNYNM